MKDNEAKAAWLRVGDELSGLGLKLKYHVEEGFDSTNNPDITDALQRLAAALDDAVETAENVVKDPAVRDDVLATGKRLVEAMSVTFEQAQKDLRNRKKQ